MDLQAEEILKDDPTVIFWQPVLMDDRQVENLFQELSEVVKRYTHTAPDESVSEHLLGIQIIRRPD